MRRREARRQHLGYGVDETRRRRNGSGRLGGRYRRGRRAYRIVGPRLELIGRAEEGDEVTRDAWLGSRQPGKFGADAAMRLCHLAGVLENVSFGGMEYSKVCAVRAFAR